MVDEIAVRRQSLLRRFSIDRGSSPAEREQTAASLFRQFTLDLQDHLIEWLEHSGTPHQHDWVRRCFDDEAGSLGIELRNAVPQNERHDLAQVLQREMLDAERRLRRALKTYSLSVRHDPYRADAYGDSPAASR